MAKCDKKLANSLQVVSSAGNVDIKILTQKI